MLSHIPVFGVPRDLPADPFYHMRLMMASGRGSLLELGECSTYYLTVMLCYPSIYSLLSLLYRPQYQILHLNFMAIS